MDVHSVLRLTDQILIYTDDGYNEIKIYLYSY